MHFAVSNSEVHMVTKLDGPATVFLPFNLGNDGAAGTPVNPAGGHRTADLWEQVWARESWLEILGRYLIAQRDKKKQIERIIFPRFHQLDVTRKLQAAVLADGQGGKYLIQRSAGSGKTNSIAWTAHFLAELHDAHHNKVFDTVLVVSDRNVIDSQLPEALFDFQRTTGVVATIRNTDGSKSAALAAALSGDKKIVVCTIQTFPFALEVVRKLAATQGKRFAVIADEAHSSQTGDAAAKLKAVLGPEELQELNDGGEVSTEDIPKKSGCQLANFGATGVKNPQVVDILEVFRQTLLTFAVSLVPGAGIEPARCFQRGILSPVRLPIPPSRQRSRIITDLPRSGNPFSRFIISPVRADNG